MPNAEFEEWKILNLFKEDVYRGWVRINIDDRKDKNGNEIFTRKDLVIIEYENHGHPLIRRVLGDEKQNSNNKCIRMDFDTKHNDGYWKLRQNNIRKFRITKVRWYRLDKKNSYYWNHPDVAIRIAFKLGFLSLLIALITLGVSIFLPRTIINLIELTNSTGI